ncbi:MAG: LysR family transcriptional regulator [Syntrophobacteraceae bacterium]|nr:LysR family transcriptional regulator [Syntrophobacteraceae bacterium]
MGNFQLNLHHVISFYFVAKEQSFSRAAELLSITQPAVTQHIRFMETQFAVKLVNIKKKRVNLTKAGERLLPYAEELFNQSVLTENFLKGYRYNHISIGIASPLVFFFTALIDHFKELYPSVRVTIRDGSSRPMVEELLDFRIDICIIGILFPYNDRLRLFRIPVDEQLFLVAAPDYPLLPDTPVKWSQLASHPLIIQSEGSASRAILLNHFKKRGINPLIGAEVNNVELAKQLARQKKGIAFMFEANIREEVEAGRLRVIPTEDGNIRMGGIDVLVNKEERLSPTVESLLAVIREHFKGCLHEMAPQ